MDAKNLFEDIEDYITAANIEELILVYNFIFPDEEAIVKESMETVEVFSTDVACMIIDEVENYNLQELLNVHNKIFDGNLTLDEIYSD